MAFSIQIIGHDVGKEDGEDWTRIRGLTSKGKTMSMKFKADMATSLTSRLKATLGEGETIIGKKLFLEVEGEFEIFYKGQYKVRYFEPSKFTVVQGPALELARMRHQAASLIEMSEALRQSGNIAKAYKMVASYVAELGLISLDLGEIDDLVDDHLLGAEEEYNPEAAAEAHYARQEAAEKAEIAADDDDIAIEMTPHADDDILMSAPEDGDEPEVSEGLEINQQDEEQPVEDQDEDTVDEQTDDAGDSVGLSDEEIDGRFSSDRRDEPESAPAPTPTFSRPAFGRRFGR